MVRLEVEDLPWKTKPEDLLQAIKEKAMPVTKIYTTHINPLLNDGKWQEYEKDSPQSNVMRTDMLPNC